VEVGILGPLEVRTTSGVVAVRRGLPRTVLTALLLRRGQTVSSDFLVDLLWNDELPRNPANSLQIQISYLRKALGSGDPDRSLQLETRAGGYSLLVDDRSIDANRFDAAVRRFEALDALRSDESRRTALGDVESALALWRGEALEDVAGIDFFRGEIVRLDELRWAAMERRVDLLLQLGRHGDAIGDVSELVRRLPLRERFRQQLVLGLYRAGRQADALRAYEDARRTLVEQLGIEPGPALRDLEQRVLQQHPSLDWRPSTEPEPPDDPIDVRAPAAVSRPTSGRLPVPIAPLIGRDTELARLDELLGRHRLLTLTGPAGAGKTRLAIDLASRSPRPACYVDFSPIDDPALVAPTVAAAAGVTVTPGEDPVASVATALAPQDLLLVLDTCEHLVGGIGRLASAVLRAAPGVRVLATSRRALGMSGEFAWPVPPLDLPSPDAASAEDITAHAAVALFVARATAVRPDLEVDDAAARDIAAVCLALDGLPLGIELAAARADVLSPAALRARLEDRFGLLIDGGADAVERQQTLRGAIDWSFELLSDDQRTLFARLGAFAGSFDLDAALTVAGFGLDAPLELLASLVKQSMVARAGQERFRLLDTLRAYALTALGERDADATRDRHADFFVERAEQGELAIRGAEQLLWLESFRNDVNNFRAALEWSLLTGDTSRAAREAGALAWFWTLNGMLSEAIQHLEHLVDVPDVAPATRARCLWGYALLAASLGHLARAREAAYQAVDLSRSCGDDTGAAYGLNAAAVAEWALGNHERSLGSHTEAIALLDKLDDHWGLAVCNVLQARTLFDIGHAAAASVAARHGVEHARHAGDLHVLGIALTQIAQIAISDGDTPAAVVAATEALVMQEQIGYTEGTVSALHVLGRAHRLAGELDAARAEHQRALALASRIGHAAAMCEAVEDIARVAAGDDPHYALVLLSAAQEERARRALPLRQADADELGRFEATLRRSVGGAIDYRPFGEILREVSG
jgi:predicted ATPase/DNA-binding SARP family transcriptional activator